MIKSYKIRKCSLIYLLLLLSCSTVTNNTKEYNEPMSITVEEKTIGDSRVIDSTMFLGNILIDSVNFSLYNCYRSIFLANSIRGRSSLVFISETDTIMFYLDSKSDLLDSICNDKLYLNGKGVSVSGIKKGINLHNSCFLPQ